MSTINYDNFVFHSDVPMEKTLFRASGEVQSSGSVALLDIPNTTGRLLRLHIIWKTSNGGGWVSGQGGAFIDEANALLNRVPSLGWASSTPDKIEAQWFLPGTGTVTYRIMGVPL